MPASRKCTFLVEGFRARRVEELVDSMGSDSSDCYSVLVYSMIGSDRDRLLSSRNGTAKLAGEGNPLDSRETQNTVGF